MKVSWIIGALVLNLSLDQVRATQITRRELAQRHAGKGNLHQKRESPQAEVIRAVGNYGISAVDSDSSSSELAQLDDEEDQEQDEFFHRWANVQLSADEQAELDERLEPIEISRAGWAQEKELIQLGERQ